ncbi:hypothetical protein GCM10027275_19920 [Rhabdobacter roseus]|uniref:DUF4386 domain-containing protein n=1 Tax=Rhabdobacter roseus TaxID=1655419 RepID=A0A840TVE4_9BACT|nr:DUF4386 domain-containing protein [Rhabdobacter roseus]MBB5283920.1 hypothetical protein [Rhabdobacter roseus]
MKNIFKGTKSVIFLTILILSSCSTPNKVACPSFDSGKGLKNKRYKSGIKTFNVRKVFSLKKGHNYKREKMSNLNFIDDQSSDLPTEEFNSFASSEEINSHDLGHSNFDLIEQNQHQEHKVANSNKLYLKKQIKPINATSSPHIKKVFEKKNTFNKNQDTSIYEKSKRKEAIIKGGAIILMALLAGISIPALGTTTASVGLVAILLLDVLISIGIIRYYRKEKPNLAKTTGFLRILYSAIFGIGIGYHIVGNVGLFNKFWSLGLIAFGFHLIALGILFNNEGGKKWVNYTIKSLLIIAGIGYTLLNVGLLFTANPVAFTALIQPIFTVPQIVGEVLFALWMIIKGGKSENI